MKTFIVVALLVAAVAGQSMDIMKMPKETRSLKYGHYFPMVRDQEMDMMDNYMYPEHEYDTTTYTIDEITSMPLFRVYYNLPLFRQFWDTYPMFQRYVASIYFQRYWEIPTFQKYFYEPALFYKYIFPIVQLFKHEYRTMNTYSYGDWMWNKNSYPFTYNRYNTGYDYYNGEQQRDLSTHMPTICHYNRVYCKALFERLYNHFSMMMTYGQQEETMMPYSIYTSPMEKYNPYIARMIHGYYNRYPTYETERMTMPYTFNKERMFNTERMPFEKDMMTTYETPRMMKDMMTERMMREIMTPRMIEEAKYESMSPIMKTFHKKIMPETIIEA